ncbi:MAG: glycosyltransferase family 9 protein [Candidatus Binatia bacterium]
MKSFDRASAASTSKRVCVIFPGALGDFICFLPALRILTRAAQVDLFAQSEFADIVPAEVTVRSLECFAISRLFMADPAQNPDLRSLFGAYAAVYSWMGSQHSEFVNQLQTVSDGRAKIFPFRPMGTIEHQADYYLRCLAATKFNGIEPTIDHRAVAIAWRENFWRENSLHHRAVLTISPGSGAREKNWPEEFFLAVAKWWRESVGGIVILLVGPVEVERGGVDRLQENCLVLRDLRLSQVAALLDRSVVYLGNDSGVSHLASAIGVPTVALFGPSDPRQWAPRGKKVTVISRQIHCSPCAISTMKGCPGRACLS